MVYACIGVRMRVVNKYKEPYSVYIGRGSVWGNPFQIGVHGTREEVIRMHADWLVLQLDLMQQIPSLEHETLGCFCKPQPCHGDTLEYHMAKVINNFHSDPTHAFLSNMALLDEPIVYEDIEYKSVENFYQAMKTTDQSLRISQIDLTPHESKKWGRRLPLRANWESIKRQVMWYALTQKFSQPRFAALMCALGDAVLVEGNYWHDTYWGVCKGVGENHLGKMLTEIKHKLLYGQAPKFDTPAGVVKDQLKGALAESYIGIGVMGSSTHRYAQFFSKVNAEEYKQWERVFVSINGARPNAVALKAIEPYLVQAADEGVMFIADNPYHRNRSYNVGEAALAKFLQELGYVDYPNQHYSVWLPKPEAE